MHINIIKCMEKINMFEGGLFKKSISSSMTASILYY